MRSAVSTDDVVSREAGHPVVLYDGVCGLCNGMVQFILRGDAAGVFRFASLQSELAGKILARHGADARDLDTFYVVLNYEMPDENVLARSDAVICVLQNMGMADVHSEQAKRAAPTQIFWRMIGWLLHAVPSALREWAYEFVVRNRYRIFGRYDSCPVPSPETRSRFLS